MEDVLLFQGAESKIYTANLFNMNVLVKERFPKMYRNTQLDNSLTRERMKAECRNIVRCKQAGVRTPAIYKVDLENRKIYMEYFASGRTLKQHIENSGGANNCIPIAMKIGQILARMHLKDIIHGDLTTSNMILLEKNEIVLIDFGLSQCDGSAEDKGVDLYVLERALSSTHANSDEFFNAICDSYSECYGKKCGEILNKYSEVRARGRKRTMIG